MARSPRKLNSSTASPVFDPADGAGLVRDDEAWEPLIVPWRRLRRRTSEWRRRARERAALAAHVYGPAPGDHRPVGFVPVHGEVHAAAAGRDAVVPAADGQLAEHGFERLDPRERGARPDVAAVGQGVDPQSPHAVVRGPLDQGAQVVDVAVHVAVAHEAEQVQRAPRTRRPRRTLEPAPPRGPRRRASRPGRTRGRPPSRCARPRCCPCRRRRQAHGRPCANSGRHGHVASRRSRFGVSAVFTPSSSWPDVRGPRRRGCTTPRARWAGGGWGGGAGASRTRDLHRRRLRQGDAPG
jgi:hypothetical protein